MRAGEVAVSLPVSPTATQVPHGRQLTSLNSSESPMAGAVRACNAPVVPLYDTATASADGSAAVTASALSAPTASHECAE